MKVQYLEVVTPEVNLTCEKYEHIFNAKFDKATPELGDARVAKLASDGMIGVRSPMHETEAPVVRPYMLVDDIENAIANAVKAGADIAHPPLELPGYGKFAIYSIGGIQHGLW